LLPTLHAAALRGLNSIVSFLTSIALFVNVTGNSSPSIDRNWGLGWRRKTPCFLCSKQRLHELDAYFACHASRLCADELEAIHWSLKPSFLNSTVCDGQHL
jgi:hypothetical protein